MFVGNLPTRCRLWLLQLFISDVTNYIDQLLNYWRDVVGALYCVQAADKTLLHGPLWRRRFH